MLMLLCCVVSRLERPGGTEVELKDLGDDFNQKLAVLDEQEDAIVRCPVLLCARIVHVERASITLTCVRHACCSA